MENKKTNKDFIKTKAILSTVLLLLPYLLDLCYKNNVTKIINIGAVVIYSCILIPYTFNILGSSLLPLPSKMNKYYNILHIFYVILPIALVGQVLLIEQIWWMVLITQVISIGNLIILYRCYKHLIKDHLEYLRYSNKLITGIFTFLLTLLYLFNDSMKIEFALLFLQPLVGLLLLYETIYIYDKDKDADCNGT